MDLIGETILKWFITFLLGTIMGFVISRLKKEKNKNKSIENAVQSLLRDRLIEKYRLFKIKGKMTILDKENIDHLYKEYKNLGGNGTVEKLYKDLSNLEIKVIKE